MRIVDSLVASAPIAEVWDRTIDIEAWPDHVATMTSVHRLDAGPLAVGSTVRIVQPRQRPRVWTVTHLEPPLRFAWETRLLGATMTATHVLEPHEEGTRSTLGIELEGFLAPVLALFLRVPIARALAVENRSLAALSEARHG